jgi:hypothetical protein
VGKITSFLTSSSVLLCMSLAPGALAQQINGTPGSPSATTTIDGKQLPPEPPKFGGVINEDAKQSTPYWPPSVVPPKGAPNVRPLLSALRSISSPHVLHLKVCSSYVMP